MGAKVTVSAFKKKETNEPLVPYGTVVLLNSDIDGSRPMTTGETKGGQVLCRWFDDVGNCQGDWFYPEELHLQDAEEVAFEVDFEVKDK